MKIQDVKRAQLVWFGDGQAPTMEIVLDREWLSLPAVIAQGYFITQFIPTEPKPSEIFGQPPRIAVMSGLVILECEVN